MLLAEPYEYLDLHSGQTIILRVDSYLDGTAVIHPGRITPRHVRIHMDQRQLTTPPVAGEPIANEVPVLRLFGARIDEVSPAKYFDTSSKTLRADLLARFQAGLTLPAVIELTANGHAPIKRFSVSVG